MKDIKQPRRNNNIKKLRAILKELSIMGTDEECEVFSLVGALTYFRLKEEWHAET